MRRLQTAGPRPGAGLGERERRLPRL